MTLQVLSETTDDYGGQNATWSTVSKLWGGIEPRRGAERYFAHQVDERTTHKVTIRYRSDVTAKNRLLFGARVFNVRGVLNMDERKRFMVLGCEEGVAT